MQFIYQHVESPSSSGPSVRALATAAEDAGWEGFAFTEHPIPPAAWMDGPGHPDLDPFVALSHVGAVTTRLRLLTYLAVAPYRNPFLLAKAAATVDKLAGGRLILGLGAGYVREEFDALGVDFDERSSLFDEALDVLPCHWSGQPFTYRGRHFDARDVVALPRPVQDPIPLWIGGNSRAAMRRAAERGHGWMPVVGPAELFVASRTAPLTTTAQLKAKVSDLRAMPGRRAQSLDVAVRYAPRWVDGGIGRDGREDEEIAELAEAGVTCLVVPAPASSGIEFVEAFAKAHLS